MSKRIVIFIMFLFSLVSCKSNYTRIGDKNANYIPYYLKVYEADSLYLVGDYQQSYQILDSLFKKYEPLNQSSNILYLNEYEKYIKLKSKMNIQIDKNDFFKLVLKYGYKFSDVVNDYELNKIRKELIIKDEELYDKYEKYLHTINYGLRNQLKEMNDKDQQIRKERRKINDSLGLKDYNDKMIKADSLNAISLRKIFKKYKGYPYPKYTGHISIQEKKYDTYVLMSELILHQCTTGKTYERDFFLNFLYIEMLKGRFNPVEYAICYDRINLNKTNEKFLFSDTRNRETLNERERIEINKIRKEFGVFSIEYQIMKDKLLNN